MTLFTIQKVNALGVDTRTCLSYDDWQHSIMNGETFVEYADCYPPKKQAFRPPARKGGSTGFPISSGITPVAWSEREHGVAVGGRTLLGLPSRDTATTARI